MIFSSKVCHYVNLHAKINAKPIFFSHTPLPQAPVYMRTFFAYDPANDTHIPCPEAGLKFERGSILQVMNQDDPNWWQAVKLGDRKIAGIIPSQKLSERCVFFAFMMLRAQK